MKKSSKSIHNLFFASTWAVDEVDAPATVAASCLLLLLAPVVLPAVVTAGLFVLPLAAPVAVPSPAAPAPLLLAAFVFDDDELRSI